MPCHLVWEVKFLTTITVIGTNSGLRVDLNSATINHLEGQVSGWVAVISLR
jgi:hypothetical protein